VLRIQSSGRRLSSRWARALPALLVPTLLLGGPAAAADREPDPWEGFNRGVYVFNDKLDRWALKPMARTYDTLLPKAVKRGVGNVFDNIGMPAVAVNQLLQGKPRSSLSSVGRFLLNSTLGVGGLLDPATRAGLDKRPESFGQTLEVWGVARGPFLMLPFFGPSTVTHSGGLVVDWVMNPLRFIQPESARFTVIGVSVVETRASLLSTGRLLSGDRYLFVRDAYLQNLASQVRDGKDVQDDPFLDEFDDF